MRHKHCCSATFTNSQMTKGSQFCNHLVWRFVLRSNGGTQEKYKSHQKEQAKHCHFCPSAQCRLTNEWARMKWNRKKFPDFVYLFRTWKFDLEYLLFQGACTLKTETKHNWHIDVMHFLFQKLFTSYFSLQYWHSVKKSGEENKENHEGGCIVWRTDKFPGCTTISK